MSRARRPAGTQIIGWLILIIGLALAALGYFYVHGWNSEYVVQEFYANASTTLLGTAVVILVVDRLNERRDVANRLDLLLREMASRDRGIALRATAELRVGGHLSDGSLNNCDLSLANLEGAQLAQLVACDAQMQGVRLQGAVLSDACLAGSNLNRANLCRANLEGANLSGTSLVEANLEDADLGGASLRGATLAESIVTGADLRGSDLREADLRSIDLRDARLQGALVGDAQYDESTQWPEHAPQRSALEGKIDRWDVDVVWPD